VPYRPRSVRLAATLAICVGWCAPVHSQAPDQQSRQAIIKGCIEQMKQAQLAGAPPAQILQMRQECMTRAAATLEPQREQMVSAMPGVAGETTRAFLAAHRAETAGNQQEAFRLYWSIDANAAAIEAEVSRLAGATVSPRNTLATNQEIVNNDGLGSALITAQRKIGEYYERGGDYRTAASYYQKALNTARTQNGTDTVASVRLGFLYAYGRGVPQDRARAMELFGGTRGGGTLRSKTETGFAYLLDHNQLPNRPEDVNPQRLAAIEDQEIKQKLFSWLLVAGLFKKASVGTPAQCTATCNQQALDCQDHNRSASTDNFLLPGSGNRHDCRSEYRSCISWCD
jgi:TPR repeat protein